MITARFASGIAVQYNTASYVVWATPATPCHRLYESKDGKIVASVPSDAIVEFMAPCRVYRGGNDVDSVLAGMLELLKTKPSLSWSAGDTLRDIKRRLAAFNARRKVWE